MVSLVRLLRVGLLLAVSQLEAQETSSYVVSQWQTEDGLPQLSVRAITQTRDGYLWVGTFNGLARFDGVRFTAFTVGNTPQLPSDNVNVLYEDRAGDLWIGTEDGGLIRYRRGAFISFGPDHGLTGRSVRAVREDGEGTLWIGTGSGLFRRDGERFEMFSAEPAFAGQPIGDLCLGAQGELWVGSRNVAYALRDGKLAAPPIAIPHPAKKLLSDNSGHVWLLYGTRRLARLDREKNAFEYEPDMFRTTTMRLVSGELWLGTFEHGFFAATAGVGPKPISIPPLPGWPEAIFEDKEKNVWVGVASGGLCRLRKKLVATFSAPEYISHQSITTVFEDHAGTVWAGTFGKGLHARMTGQFEFVETPNQGGNVSAIWETPDGTLWCGTYGSGLLSRGLDGHWVSNALATSSVRTLFGDREGTLWVGTIRYGAQRLTNGNVFQGWTRREGLSDNHVFAFAQDHSGDIWIGTAKGLNRLSGNQITHFYREDGVGANAIRVLFVDSAGALWIGSVGGGLTRFKDGRFSTVTMRDGLLSDWIEQIQEDGQQHLWLGTGVGIMHVSLKELNLCADHHTNSLYGVRFGREEGLTHMACGSGFQPSSMRDRAGNLWFCTVRGLVVVNPDQARPIQSPPAVYLEELLVNGQRSKDALAAPISEPLLPAIISPGQERLEIRYTGLSLSAPNKMRFRYRLEGYDRDWVEAGTSRTAVYAHVPPGKYRFRVIAVNNGNVWSPTGASLTMVVQPFIWQTRTFHAVLATMILGLTALAVRAILARKHRLKIAALQRAHALELERTRIAQDIHDDLGARLTQIGLMSERARRSPAVPPETRKQLEKIAEKSRATVQAMDAIVWVVDPAMDTLESLANYLAPFAEEFFQDGPIRCRLDLPEALPHHPLSAELRHNLFLVFKEALNNVARHSCASEVWIRLEVQNGAFSMTIQDNGRGFDRARTERTGAGNGLKNMGERIRSAGGEFDLVSAPGAGTRLVVRLQLEGPRPTPIGL